MAASRWHVHPPPALQIRGRSKILNFGTFRLASCDTCCSTSGYYWISHDGNEVLSYPSPRLKAQKMFAGEKSLGDEWGPPSPNSSKRPFSA
ncbi:hypothetical protein TNIN_499101 [Trichonephila inaurata madagascariensis]|uniref:Uncharacterized protein n=1 Tax=Trichonephila inaurata madagascariensis TaxID=2747483 RepID=A0A8X7BPR3_9ARAC|nr:hypothetical protein TNIN_499101 [Trichonephila inaurata madagascariensis]